VLWLIDSLFKTRPPRRVFRVKIRFFEEIPMPVKLGPVPVELETPPKPAVDLSALVREALARTDSRLMQWAGGNTQFEATRFTLNGQFNALRAVALALQGDPKAMEGL
jgi:hypothetical protein